MHCGDEVACTVNNEAWTGVGGSGRKWEEVGGRRGGRKETEWRIDGRVRVKKLE